MVDEEPVSIVIFGASGDLTKRKLIPALYHLYRKKRLPEKTKIIGFARHAYTHESFREHLVEGLQKFAKHHFSQLEWQKFSKMVHYFPGDISKDEDFFALHKTLEKIENGPAHRLYYLATSPTFFPAIIKQLGNADMTAETRGWRRLVIEKPFGRDISSARELNKAVHAVVEEHQVYRIDHYLGKETAQNILFFRFGNTIFEPIWNRNYIDNIQITVAETVDVGHRAGYYDTAGVFRDMFQNHLLQLLALTAMEPPASFDADAVRNEKVKLLSAIRPISAESVANHVVRAQYKGYSATNGVHSHSTTPTYAALRFFIDNWRWRGVPFYLRSGKALKEKASYIAIQFTCPPHIMFPMPPGKFITPNLLLLCIQPDEGMHLRYEVKEPDTLMDTKSVHMTFHYDEVFGERNIPDAYERLLLDALNGDASLFTRSDGIESAWRLMDSIIQGCDGPQAPSLALYTPGSWGPAEANKFIVRSHRTWHTGCEHEH